MACIEWNVDDNLMKSLVLKDSFIWFENMRVYTNEPFLLTTKNARCWPFIIIG